MTLSVAEFATAKQAANDLLDALGLTAYQFEVGPDSDQWVVHVECAIDEGWMSTHFGVEAGLLQQSSKDPEVRERLLVSWRKQLQACQKGTATPTP